MITTLLFDFSRVFIHPKDQNYKGGMNELHHALNTKNEPYEFSDYFVLNEELLEFLRTIKNRISIYMFTKETLQERKEVAEKIDFIFNRIFSAKKLGLEKNDPHAYLFICKEIDKNPREIAFIDDTVTNIEAAEKAGLETIHYVSNEQTIEKIKKLIE